MKNRDCGQPRGTDGRSGNRKECDRTTSMLIVGLLDKMIVGLMLAILITLAFPLSGITAPAGLAENNGASVRKTPGDDLRPMPHRPGAFAHSRVYTA